MSFRATLSSALGLPWDPIAIAVVLSAVLHRILFRYPVIGERKKGLLNMKPFEENESRVKFEEEEHDQMKEDGSKKRLLVEPWLPHQYHWGDVTMLGLTVGILAAFITYTTGSIFLPFGISAASLLFLNLGVVNFPVTHHISLIGSVAIVAGTGGEYAESSLFVMLVLGGTFGILAALFGELTGKASVIRQPS